ncbi:MAG: hypothetical protein OEM62_10210 [Acidobacteriota bacterium]|nr:hypothetical protein [Acidobacteriota bacterium]
MSEVMARGPNFVYGQEFILASHGAAVWEKILADMPEDASNIWRDTLLVTGSYPFSSFKTMLASLARVVGEVPEAETEKMYEFIADQSLSTIHKFFFRFADPSFIIKRYPILWKRFFQSGEVRVPHAEKGSARLEFDLPEIFLDWLQPACYGYSKKAIEMAGGSDLELTPGERRQIPGDLWRIPYELRWSE